MLRACVNFCAARSVFGALACALAAILSPQAALAQPAAAAQEDLLTLRLSRTPNWDTNVLRVVDEVSDPQLARGISGKSDRFIVDTVGLHFSKSYAQQSVLFDIDQTSTRYDKFSFLNRDALNYRAAWQWHLTPRISGTLSADQAGSVVGFDDTQVQTLTTTVTRNRNLSIDAWLFGGWHLLAGTARSERKTSQLFLAVPSSDQVMADFGLRYDTASRGSITVTRRRSRGVTEGQDVDRVNFIDNVFTLTETDLRATWVTSGKSTLTAHLGRVERRHDNIPQRDFSAIAGDATFAWTPTSKLSVNLSATRVIAPFTTGTSATYRADDTLAFVPAWQASEKIRLNMRASRRTSTFLGPVVPVVGPPRRDVLGSVLFGADWTAHPKVTLRATLQRDRRTSTDATLFFNDRVATFSVSLTY